MSGAAPILVVEDDTDLREGMVDILADGGYEAEEASSGREALERLRGPRLPGLIVLDLMMPDLNGLQFLEIRSHDPRLAEVPVLVVTAGRKVTADLEGAEVLLKPFSVEDLMEKIHRLTA